MTPYLLSVLYSDSPSTTLTSRDEPFGDYDLFVNYIKNSAEFYNYVKEFITFFIGYFSADGSEAIIFSSSKDKFFNFKLRSFAHYSRNKNFISLVSDIFNALCGRSFVNSSQGLHIFQAQPIQIDRYLLTLGLEEMKKENINIDPKSQMLDLLLQHQWQDGKIHGLHYNFRVTISQFIKKTDDPTFNYQ